MARDIRQCLAVCLEPSRPGLWIGDVEPNGDRHARSRQVNLPDEVKALGKAAFATAYGAGLRVADL